MDNNKRDIAIIGIALRMPGANTVDEFWNNLLEGKECLIFPNENDIKSHRFSQNSDFSKIQYSHGSIDGIELFDANFFNYSSKEAAHTDPQFRLLLECAWHALEDSGYNPDTFKKEIGVYAGSYYSSYLFNNVLRNNDKNKTYDDQFSQVYQCVNDFLASSIAYKLNLTGPSITVQTWCTTSLTAVHVACQSLRNNECEIALAGGVTIHVPQDKFTFQETGFVSTDGHCNSFDVDGHGATMSNGLGIVVLKSLDKAIKDRDNIYAVIKGTGLTNDGRPISKLSYVGITIDGQYRAIKKALDDADIDPDSVSYIEANGNATELSDRFELTAYNKAYGERVKKGLDLLIGAVKPNFGHLVAASGLASLIKASLSLKNKTIPATINFNKFNSKSIGKKSFIRVNVKNYNWDESSSKKRFGLHCFGIGGTNIHMIMEEPPIVTESIITRDNQILTFSARTALALTSKLEQYIQYFEMDNGDSFEDIAFTNNIGRKEFEYRIALVAKSKNDVCIALKNNLISKNYIKVNQTNAKQIIFVFSGYGDEYVNSAKDLFKNELLFKKYFKQCSEILKQKINIDIEDLLINGFEPGNISGIKKDDPFYEIVSLFIIEYSIAKTLIEWGITPSAVLGYSCGEFSAACISGVYTLESAISLIVDFGMKISQVDKGKMLTALLDEQDLKKYLNHNISVAAINGPSTYILAGKTEYVDQLEMQFKKDVIDYLPVKSDYAFHTNMMKPIAEQINNHIQKTEINFPEIDYYSCVTGNKIMNNELKDTGYWSDFACNTIKFEEAIKPIIGNQEYTIIEIGTSNTLTQLIKSHPSRSPQQVVLSCADNKTVPELNQKSVFQTICSLWENGHKINWDVFYSGKIRKRISLPVYPFQRERYWIEPEMQFEKIQENKIINNEVSSDQLQNDNQKGNIEYRNIEKTITTIWCKLFGVEQIGVDENFLELGGHSLLATMFVNKIRALYPNAEITFIDFFNNPTIKQISILIYNLLNEKKTPDNKRNDFKDKYLPATPTDRYELMKFFLFENISESLKMDKSVLNEESNIELLNIKSISGQLYIKFKNELDLPLYQFEIVNKTNLKDLIVYLITEYERKLGISERSTEETVEKIKPRTKTFIVNETDKNRPPIFIMTAPRSGSTLFRLMLAGHSKLFSPPELWLLGYSSMKEWNESVPFHVKNHGGVYRSIKELMGLNQDSSIAYLNELIDQDVPVQEVYRLIQKHAGNKILVDKCPDNTSAIENLERAEQMFDKPLYIHLIRHPYAVIESNIRIGAYRVFTDKTNNPYLSAEMDWYNRNMNLLSFFNSIDSKRHFLVRYEDLIKETKVELIRICDFLNIPFEETLLKPYDNNRMIDGDGDPNIFNHDDINPELADVWKNIQLPYPLTDKTKELAVRFGYELPFDAILPSNEENIAEKVNKNEIDENKIELNGLSINEIDNLINKLGDGFDWMK